MMHFESYYYAPAAGLHFYPLLQQCCRLHPTVERTLEYSMSNTAPRNESIPDLEDHLHGLIIDQQGAASRL